MELIDFIIKSTEHVLHENFDVGFNDRSVKVLDPFTGTGTFLTRILESGFVTTNLYEKYKHDLFANELILLAYYIATVNVETTYASLRKSGKYVPFDGINYTDTLQMSSRFREETRHRIENIPFDDIFKTVQKRVIDQSGAHVHVIMGNPPYSKGQSTYNFNNPNIKYPELDERIKETYARKANSNYPSSLYDSYVRSLRWASDRIGKTGIISFVVNAGFINSNNGSGIRGCLAEEFDEIWCFNLRGDGRTTGDGRNIFEYPGKSSGGTRTPVAIIVLVKKKEKQECVIRYHAIGDEFYSGKNKRDRVKELGSILGIEDWQIIKPDVNYDWLNQRDSKFTKYLSMGNENAKSGRTNAVFNIYSPGVGTNRDEWAYNFSKSELTKNMKCHIEYCNKQNLNDSKIDKKIHDLTQVKWTTNLSKKLKRTKPIFSRNNIRVSLYRPFFKQFLYFDNVLTERPGLALKYFPDEESENLMICITHNAKTFSTIITNVIPNLDCLEHTECFPLYIYDIHKERTENITSDTLKEYQLFYADKKITKEDIFYYVYGLLHHPTFREKFANNLSKDFPHIPMAPKFWEYVMVGKKLAELHLNFENSQIYDLGKPKNNKFGKVKKLTLRKIENNEHDHSMIWVNTLLVFDNIPKINYRVNGRTPLEWVVDRFKIFNHKDSRIINQPGDVDIISIIGRAVYIGIESDKIIQELPDEFEPKNWISRKTGLEKFE